MRAIVNNVNNENVLNFKDAVLMNIQLMCMSIRNNFSSLYDFYQVNMRTDINSGLIKATLLLIHKLRKSLGLDGLNGLSSAVDEFCGYYADDGCYGDEEEDEYDYVDETMDAIYENGAYSNNPLLKGLIAKNSSIYCESIMPYYYTDYEEDELEYGARLLDYINLDIPFRLSESDWAEVEATVKNIASGSSPESGECIMRFQFFKRPENVPLETEDALKNWLSFSACPLNKCWGYEIVTLDDYYFAFTFESQIDICTGAHYPLITLSLTPYACMVKLYELFGKERGWW